MNRRLHAAVRPPLERTPGLVFCLRSSFFASAAAQHKLLRRSRRSNDGEARRHVISYVLFARRFRDEKTVLAEPVNSFRSPVDRGRAPEKERPALGERRTKKFIEFRCSDLKYLRMATFGDNWRAFLKPSDVNSCKRRVSAAECANRICRSAVCAESKRRVSASIFRSLTTSESARKDQ